MASLWTPEGEHRVATPQASTPAGPGQPASGGAAAGDGDDREFTEEEIAEAREEFARLEEEVLAAPVEDVIANHCYGLFQLAALHLGQRPPDLEQGRTAIDALAGVVDALGERLGTHAPTFRDGLAQLRLAFVQLRSAQDAESGAETPVGGAAPSAEDSPEPDSPEPDSPEPVSPEPVGPEPDSSESVGPEGDGAGASA